MEVADPHDPKFEAIFEKYGKIKNYAIKPSKGEFGAKQGFVNYENP
jgi:hypothetical protein